MAVGGQRQATVALLWGRCVGTHCIERWVQGYGEEKNVFPSLGFKLQTVQTVASGITV
jgi:hypothetical protein